MSSSSFEAPNVRIARLGVDVLPLPVHSIIPPLPFVQIAVLEPHRASTVTSSEHEVPFVAVAIRVDEAALTMETTMDAWAAVSWTREVVVFDDI